MGTNTAPHKHTCRDNKTPKSAVVEFVESPPHQNARNRWVLGGWEYDFEYGESFYHIQHEIAFCPFCGIRLSDTKDPQDEVRTMNLVSKAEMETSTCAGCGAPIRNKDAACANCLQAASDELFKDAMAMLDDAVSLIKRARAGLALAGAEVSKRVDNFPGFDSLR